MRQQLLLSFLIAIAIATFSLGGIAALGAEGAQAQEMMPTKTGDLNKDGVANSLDALIVLFYEAGLSEPPKDVDAWTIMADIDCDLAVTALDASLILQADAGLYQLRT